MSFELIEDRMKITTSKLNSKIDCKNKHVGTSCVKIFFHY